MKRKPLGNQKAEMKNLKVKDVLWSQSPVDKNYIIGKLPALGSNKHSFHNGAIIHKLCNQVYFASKSKCSHL